MMDAFLTGTGSSKSSPIPTGHINKWNQRIGLDSISQPKGHTGRCAIIHAAEFVAAADSPNT